MSGSHEKLPWLFWVQLVLVAVVATLYFMNSGKHEGSVAHGDGSAAGHETSDASKQALKPIGEVAVTGATDPAAGGSERSGKDIVTKTCQSCHAHGVANAPKLDEGAKADWEARMAKGLDEVIAVAKKGKGAMPPMGTDPSLSDAELKNAIVYMLEKAGVDAGDTGSSSSAPADPAVVVVEEVASSEVSAGVTNNDEGAESEEAAPAAPSAPAAPEPPATPSAAAAETIAVAATGGAGEAAVTTAEPAGSTPEAKPAIDGAKLYSTTCFACHDTGAAGAPKVGDKAAWADRIAQGKEALYEAAIKGKTSPTGVMPPKGGYMNLSDDEVKAIVDHIVSKSE